MKSVSEPLRVLGNRNVTWEVMGFSQFADKNEGTMQSHSRASSCQ